MPADAPVSRLHSDDSAERCRLPDRPAGLGPEGERHDAGGNCRCRSAGRTAGYPADVVRIPRRTVCAVFGRRAHRKLVHVGLSDDDGALLPQSYDRRRFVRTDIACEDFRGTRRRKSECCDVVLHRDRHAGEASALSRLGHSFGKRIGIPDCELTIAPENHVQRIAIRSGFDGAVKARLNCVSRRDLSGPDAGRETNGGENDQNPSDSWSAVGAVFV